MELIVHSPEKQSTVEPTPHIYPVQEVNAAVQKSFFNITTSDYFSGRYIFITRNL